MPKRKENTMSVTKDEKVRNPSLPVPEAKKKRRYLSPEKKFQIFLESQVGKTPVGEILRREGQMTSARRQTDIRGKRWRAVKDFTLTIKPRFFLYFKE